MLQELPKRLLQVQPMLELQEPEIPQGLERQKLKKQEPQELQMPPEPEMPMLPEPQERPQAETAGQAWPSGSSDASRQILYEDAD